MTINQKKEYYTKDEIILILGFGEEFDDENQLQAYAEFYADDIRDGEFSREHFEDCFEGCHETWETFCKDYVDNCYNLDNLFDEKKSDLGNLTRYLTFDWETMANDWEQSGDWATIELEGVNGSFFFRNT
jgi:antirestriction protein